MATSEFSGMQEVKKQPTVNDHIASLRDGAYAAFVNVPNNPISAEALDEYLEKDNAGEDITNPPPGSLPEQGTSWATFIRARKAFSELRKNDKGPALQILSEELEEATEAILVAAQAQDNGNALATAGARVKELKGYIASLNQAVPPASHEAQLLHIEDVPETTVIPSKDIATQYLDVNAVPSGNASGAPSTSSVPASQVPTGGLWEAAVSGRSPVPSASFPPSPRHPADMATTRLDQAQIPGNTQATGEESPVQPQYPLLGSQEDVQRKQASLAPNFKTASLDEGQLPGVRVSSQVSEQAGSPQHPADMETTRLNQAQIPGNTQATGEQTPVQPNTLRIFSPEEEAEYKILKNKPGVLRDALENQKLTDYERRLAEWTNRKTTSLPSGVLPPATSGN